MSDAAAVGTERPTTCPPNSEPASAAPPPGLVARALRRVVVAYQHLMAGRISPCRFYPSCSAYAAEALEVHGAGRGSWLAARRLARCHPWGGHGIDLVPERKAP